jgi:hypothetical protein
VRARFYTPLSNFIVDSSTDTHFPEDKDESDVDSDANTTFETSCPSSPETEEFIALSNDSIKYMAAHDVSRRDSYDSRIKPYNEDYTLDDFVVDDDSFDESSDAGSEITITMSTNDTKSAPATASQSSMSRRNSAISTASESSALFVTDDDEECLAALSLGVETFFHVVDDHVEPTDVAEEIFDAVCRFSRRCNRNCAPLHLELSHEMSEHDALDEAIQFAVTQGLGKYKIFGDGRVWCVVGPRESSSFWITT